MPAQAQRVPAQAQRIEDGRAKREEDEKRNGKDARTRWHHLSLAVQRPNKTTWAWPAETLAYSSA